MTLIRISISPIMTRKQAHTPTHAHTRTHTHTQTHAHTSSHTHTQTHTHKHTHTRMYLHIDILVIHLNKRWTELKIIEIVFDTKCSQNVLCTLWNTPINCHGHFRPLAKGAVIASRFYVPPLTVIKSVINVCSSSLLMSASIAPCV